MSSELPDIERGETWTHEHMHQCQVRQLLRWRHDGNKAAIEVMQRSPLYPALREEAIRQWNLGNRGEIGDWR